MTDQFTHGQTFDRCPGCPDPSAHGIYQCAECGGSHLTWLHQFSRDRSVAVTETVPE